MSKCGRAAIQLAQAGLAVLPLCECNKIPSIKGGCKSATDDVAQVRAWWALNPKHNVGIATGSPSRGLVVIDFDVDPDKGEDGYETLRTWEREHGELPETVTAITGRGGIHYYYRCNTPIACSVNAELGVDIRGDGGFVVAPPSIHPNGRTYEWENDPCEVAIAEADDNVYAFIRYVQGEKRRSSKFKLPELIGAGTRNDTLFRYGSSLQAQGYDDVYISMALTKVNSERCKPPLPEDIGCAIVTSVTECYEKGGGKLAAKLGEGSVADSAPIFLKRDKYGNPTGAVLHNVVGRELIEGHKACFVDGAPAIWPGARYATGWDGVNRTIVELIDDCKMADQKEICHYVHLMAPKVAASNPCLIAFESGVLDIDYGFSPYDDTMVITNVIPHSYIEDAYCKDVDEFLDRVSAGDFTVRQNLEEVIGVCMYRANDFGERPVLIGSGSNGKSTYIAALRNVLGAENVSSLDINVVGKPFQAARLVGKLANLGDNISNERLNGDTLAVFKKIVTGEWIYTDVKNGDGFEFKPYCTLVFSCNEFPSLGDSSDGMLRRLFPIPFDARFSKRDAGYDPRLYEKLTTEDAAAYMIRLGIEGLARVRFNHGLTLNARSERLVREVRSDNDSVLQWVEDESVSANALAESIIADTYAAYKEWCETGGLRPFNKTKFTRKINDQFGFESVTAKRDYANGKRTVRIFRNR